MTLLKPIQAAAERSSFVKELADSGNIYQPLAYPREAYRFLEEIPVFEESGLLVRVPDWWKASRPPRPVVSVKIGEARQMHLDVDASLDFSVEVAFDGQPLGEDEIESLLASSAGLVSLRGQWVEVDREKLTQALSHWKKLESDVLTDGISFFEGMRLLSGVPLAGDAGFKPLAETTEWTGISVGANLEQLLRELANQSHLSALRRIRCGLSCAPTKRSASTGCISCLH